MPSQPRYHDTGRGSLFGDLAYQRLLERHPGHFLIALQRLFDWDAKSAELISSTRARASSVVLLSAGAHLQNALSILSLRCL